MEFEITKEELLRPLQKVIGVVDKKQLQPILSFVLLTFNDNELVVSATDLDIELSAKNQICPQNYIGKLVLPARKLLDICKSLPDNSKIKISKNDNERVTLLINRSRFTLLSQSPEEYPLKNDQISGFSFEITQSDLKSLLNNTSFAIAQQDVRHYLMGMLWEFTKHRFKVVATDGHRLATSSYLSKKIFPNYPVSLIMHRKGIGELSKLLDEGDGVILIHVNERLAMIETDTLCFTTKLIDAKFPDYSRVFPDSEGASFVELDKNNLKDILSRVSVLSNEKHRAVRFCFSENLLVIAANNQEQEQAEEVIEIVFNGLPLEICFNYSYLLDVLLKVPTDKIRLQLKKANTPVLITPVYIKNTNFEEPSSSEGEDLVCDVSYIIMPMCL